MKKSLAALLVGLLAANLAFAQVSNCEANAVGKNGKPLAGAAKASFMKKCEADAKKNACAAQAVGSNGKPLVGAAKNSFMKKCEAGK